MAWSVKPRHLDPSAHGKPTSTQNGEEERWNLDFQPSWLMQKTLGLLTLLTIKSWDRGLVNLGWLMTSSGIYGERINTFWILFIWAVEAPVSSKFQCGLGTFYSGNMLILISDRCIWSFEIKHPQYVYSSIYIKEYVYVYMCMYIYTYIYIHMYIYICMYIYV